MTTLLTLYPTRFQTLAPAAASAVRFTDPTDSLSLSAASKVRFGADDRIVTKIKAYSDWLKDPESTANEPLQKYIASLQTRDGFVISECRSKLRDAARSQQKFWYYQSADLSNADLQGACLVGVSLETVNLTHANLNGTDLRGALLKNVQLDRAHLYGADLRGVDLSTASMTDVKFMEPQAHSAEYHPTLADIHTRLPNGYRVAYPHWWDWLLDRNGYLTRNN